MTHIIFYINMSNPVLKSGKKYDWSLHNVNSKDSFQSVLMDLPCQKNLKGP